MYYFGAIMETEVSDNGKQLGDTLCRNAQIRAPKLKAHPRLGAASSNMDRRAAASAAARWLVVFSEVSPGCRHLRWLFRFNQEVVPFCECGIDELLVCERRLRLHDTCCDVLRSWRRIRHIGRCGFVRFVNDFSTPLCVEGPLVGSVACQNEGEHVR